MWENYLPAFRDYHYYVCNEWTKNRGFKDTCLEKFEDVYEELGGWQTSYEDPPWLRNYDLFISHQSNLLRKDPIFYGQEFPGVPNDIPYVWPI